MIELYSNNVTVAAGTVTPTNVPLNVVSVRKGKTTCESGAGSINLNKCGVYFVAVNASGVAATAGNLTLQLAVNGQLQPDAIATQTAADTTGVNNLAFTTLVQVRDNNGCGCCDAPTVLSLLNVGEGAVYDNVNVVVTKLV